MSGNYRILGSLKLAQDQLIAIEKTCEEIDYIDDDLVEVADYENVTDQIDKIADSVTESFDELDEMLSKLDKAVGYNEDTSGIIKELLKWRTEPLS